MGPNNFFILRYREMHWTGKGDPDYFRYHEVCRTPVKQFIDELVNKYHLRIVDPNDDYGDGYEIVEEKTVSDNVDYDYIVKHSDSKHVVGDY
jgi:hypothetical protein